MSSDYTPTVVTTGFGAEALINTNFNDIKTAMDKLLNRLNTADNAMEIDLDMGGQQILNLPVAQSATDPIRYGEINSLATLSVIEDVTYQATMELDLDNGDMFDITLTGNPTINLTATKDGAMGLIRLRQDVSGARTVTWDADARYSNDISVPVLSVAGDALDYVMWRYNLADDKFDLMAVNRGF